MPQNGLNYEGRRRVAHLHTCKATGQAPHTGLVNGDIVHSGCTATATSTSKNIQVGTQNATKPKCMVNGDINHVYKGKSRGAPPSRTLMKQEGTIPAVTDFSAAGRVSRAVVPRRISVNAARSLDTVSWPCDSNQMAPEPSVSEATQKQRRWKKFGQRRPPMPPQEEDWENEIQEVTVTDWENMCFGIRPYGPEDLLHFALQDLTLKHRDTVALPLTANYSPAVHHPHPVPVHRYHFSIPTEPDQFADADM